MTTEPLWNPAELTARFEAQQNQIEALSRHLETINAAVTERMNEETPSTVRWDDLPPEEARDRWEALRGWVEWLRDRYALDSKALPWCWYLHGALIEELTALWTAHAAAYAVDADPGSPAAWHEAFARTLPRLREWNGRTGCKPGEHHDDITPDPGEPGGQWTEHLATVRFRESPGGAADA